MREEYARRNDQNRGEKKAGLGGKSEELFIIYFSSAKMDYWLHG